MKTEVYFDSTGYAKVYNCYIGYSRMSNVYFGIYGDHPHDPDGSHYIIDCYSSDVNVALKVIKQYRINKLKEELYSIDKIEYKVMN